MGNSNTDVKSSNFTVTGELNLISEGMINPAIKAPNTACTPNTSVVIEDISTIATIKVIPKTSDLDLLNNRPLYLYKSGFTTYSIITINKTTSSSDKTDVVTEVDFAIAITRAKIDHAVTSSMAAAAMLIIPILVAVRFFSFIIRANTGKAVMLMATPINKANGKKFIPDGQNS